MENEENYLRIIYHQLPLLWTKAILGMDNLVGLEFNGPVNTIL